MVFRLFNRLVNSFFQHNTCTLTSRTFSHLHVIPVLAADRTHGLVEELVRPFYAPHLVQHAPEPGAECLAYEPSAQGET